MSARTDRESLPLLGGFCRGLAHCSVRRRARSNKTNLMVFIRPTILRSAQDSAALAARRFDTVRAAQRQIDPDGEAAIDALVRDYLGATPPVAIAAPGDEVIAPPASAAPHP